MGPKRTRKAQGEALIPPALMAIPISNFFAGLAEHTGDSAEASAGRDLPSLDATEVHVETAGPSHALTLPQPDSLFSPWGDQEKASTLAANVITAAPSPPPVK